jgi:hypothetical protein
MDDKKLKNLDVLKTQIPELDENRLESIWDHLGYKPGGSCAQGAWGWCPGNVIGGVD